MSRIKTISRNIRLLLADDFLKRWESQDKHIDDRAVQARAEAEGLERRLGDRIAEVERRADAYEQALDQRIEERFAAIDKRIEEYQAALDARIEARLLGAERDADARTSALERQINERADRFETAISRRADEFEEALTQRANTFEAASANRADEYEHAIGNRLTEFETSFTQRADDYEKGMSERASKYEETIDRRLDAQYAEMEKRGEQLRADLLARAEEFESGATKRADDYEAALDARVEERFAAAELRLDTRTEEAENRLGSEFAAAIERLDKRFDERVTSTDVRLDERFVRIERRIDERYISLEQRSDARMEAHERMVDGKLHQRSQDIVDRTDLMLQIFDQRLDRMRRELIRSHTEPEAVPSQAPAIRPSRNTNADPSECASPTLQLTSFRKLAENGAAELKRAQTGTVSLYEQILSWKKIAHEGMLEFTPDEQETADYILSFLEDPKEIHYARQHLRRFIATLERIPPAQSSTDRLLELGSLSHIAPAIKKYCGYKEVHCADLWDGDAVDTKTVTQINGGETHTFELRNFNVEADRFPYPDSFFRVVLCCELIEHLRRDPMHMLWECNRVLQPEGYLLLTTPNIASARAIEGLLVGCAPYLLAQYNIHETADQHNREYAPYEVGVALAAAGFHVVVLETADVWMRSNPAILELLRQVEITTELRGDNIFALAQKVSPPVERFPKELYTE